MGTSLVVWWLRLPLPSNAGDEVSIPGQGAKITCCVMWPKQNEQNPKSWSLQTCGHGESKYKQMRYIQTLVSTLKRKRKAICCD